MEREQDVGKRISVLRMGFVSYLQPALHEFVMSLPRRGDDVTLIKSYPRDRSKPEQSPPETRSVLFELYTRRLPKSRFLEPAVFLEFVIKTIFWGVLSRPHLVVAVDVDTLLPGYVIARLCRARLVFYSLELYTERPGIRGKRFWVWLEKSLINKARLVVACEPNRARILREKYGARTLPMYVLNVPFYSTAERTDRLQRFLESNGVVARKVVLYQGAIARARCADQIIQAAALLDPGNVVVLVGSCAPEYDLEGAIDAFHAQDKVVYYGYVESIEKLKEVTDSADLGLQIQLNVGLNSFFCAPGKLFQYLMAGLPVVASNFPGMIEIVEGNEVGLCVDPENPREIAAAINRILGDDALRARMSANALRVAREKYCYEVEGKKMLDAMDQLLA